MKGEQILDYRQETIPGGDYYRDISPAVITFIWQLEDELYKQFAASSIVFTSDQASRDGGVIAHIPQRHDKHEFPVLDHLQLTCFAAANAEKVLLPLVNKDIRECVVRVVNGYNAKQTESLAMAGYLHDIEKAYELQRAFAETRPGDKPPEENPKQVTFSDEFMKTYYLELEDGRVQMDEDLLRVPRELKKFLWNQLLVRFYALYDGDMDCISSFLSAYLLVDDAIVDVAISGPDVHESALAKCAARLSKFPVDVQVAGVLLMMADNFAQGNPYKLINGMTEEESTAFHQEMRGLTDADKTQFAYEAERNLGICNDLLRSILN